MVSIVQYLLGSTSMNQQSYYWEMERGDTKKRAIIKAACMSLSGIQWNPNHGAQYLIQDVIKQCIQSGAFNE